MTTITLVEQHIIKRDNSRFAALDAAAFAAKNLYNLANYRIRQAFIHEGRFTPFAALYHLVKQTEAYQALPRKVSQLVLKQLDQNWQSFFAPRDAYTRDPSRFLGAPKLPKYKHKTKGRFLLIYNDQAISRPWLRKGVIRLSGLAIEIRTNQKAIQHVRVVPRDGHYVVEVVYERPIEPQPVDPAKIAGIDLGIDNLITLTSNQPHLDAVAVNGRIVKSINQYYNKHRARLQSYVGNRSSHKLRKLTAKRNRIIKHHMHVISRRMIDHLIGHGIGTLVIGYNAGWKQETNMGRKTNQKFVSIPHAQLVHMLTYKAQMAGIQVIEQEESYTSKCSFFDGEPIKKHLLYAGKRIARGLFRTRDGATVNADCNGAYNIIRKACPDAFSHGDRFQAHPVRVSLT